MAARPAESLLSRREATSPKRFYRGGVPMFGEVLLGLFFLALGWLCLSHAFRYRRIGYPRLTTRSVERGREDDKPKTVIPITLGILFLLIGKVLLVMALVEML